MHRVPSLLPRAVWPLLASLLALVGALSAQHVMAANPPGLAAAEGVLEILVEDHAKFARTRHFLKTANGHIELQFKGKPLTLRAGSKLRVQGSRSGNVMELSTTDSTSVTVTAPAPMPNTFGEQKVAVLLVNFIDDRTQPYTLAQANDMVFGQVNGFLKENSFQKTWLTGSTVGWFELPIAKTCDGMVIGSYARQAAASAGVDLSGYGRVMYVFPNNSACGWAGSGNVGGTSPSVWINGRLTLLVTGHELGHTFGLYHAHSLECGATAVGSGCTTWEYGDTIDIMGSTLAGHFDAFEKERLGWLNYGTQPAITTVAASGRYTIEAYALSPTGLPKALKIPRGTDPVSGAALWYYIEYRQPIGYDAALAAYTGSNFLRGLVVRSGSGADANSGLQLDMTPNSSSFDDWADAALGFGQSYTDASAGVMIVALSGDGSSAQIDVTLSAPAGCTRAAPVVSLISGASQPVTAGSTSNYGLTLTNKDSSGCGTSAFDLRATVPTGWSSSLGATRLSVDPGASASTALTVTSAPTAAPGSYGLSATATNAASTPYTASASALYAVGATLSTTVATDKTSYKFGDTVAATASVTSGSGPLANATVSFVFTKPDGSTVVRNATTDAGGVARSTYKVSRKDPAGAWQVKDNASYTGVATSATSAFTVQ